MVPTQDREAVGIMLRDMAGYIDVIVPRGGKGLVARVQQDARVPVMSHLEGICHTYVHAGADLAMARRIVVNAKMRRTGVCGATETILIDRACAATHLQPIVADLIDAGCEVRGDARTQATDKRVRAAVDSDWGKEFLDAIVAIRVVDGVDEALAHIRRYGSAHTDAIVTDDAAAAERFLNELDSAIVHAQRVDAVRRRRRVRHGRGDRHLDGQDPRARAGRRGRAHELQIRRPRHRPDPAVAGVGSSVCVLACLGRPASRPRGRR